MTSTVTEDTDTAMEAMVTVVMVVLDTEFTEAMVVLDTVTAVLDTEFTEVMVVLDTEFTEVTVVLDTVMAISDTGEVSDITDSDIRHCIIKHLK